MSGAKSDKPDAHVLADMVRTDHRQLRPVAADSELAEAVKVLTRAHKTLIWERSRHILRLRHALLAFFPVATAAFDYLAAPDAASAVPPTSTSSERPSHTASAAASNTTPHCVPSRNPTRPTCQMSRSGIR